MPDQIARENHSVPEAYLKGWAAEPGRVWAYRLLVPRESYHVWELRQTASLTRYTDLYTSSFWGSDSDQFERWLNANVEQPAAAALAKVRADEPLGANDWRSLASYAAALDLRTPASYLEHSERMAREAPELLRSTMSNLERKLRKAARRGDVSLAPAPPEANRFPVRVMMEPGKEGQGRCSSRGSIGSRSMAVVSATPHHQVD